MKDFYPEGMLSVSNDGQRGAISVASLFQAQQNGTILEANVTMCDSAHNMTVDLGCMKGLIPRDEGAIGISEGVTRDIALISRVGRPVCFIVEEIKSDGYGNSYALLSRRKAQEMCMEYVFNNLSAGDIIDVCITHLESFGAFCDFGCGNIGLLPIDSISVSRISHPKDRFKVGDTIRAVISNIGDDGRVTLSHKELLGSWEENCNSFSQGETVSGIVRSIEEYGIFVELAPNLAGLAEPKDGVKVGQTASVYIKSIIPEKMKIKLIIIDNFDGDKKTDIKYFCQDERIERWVYSPANCRKRIETNFN